MTYRLLITMWEWSAGIFLALLGWMLWTGRQPPEPQDKRIYRVWGKRR